MQISIDGCVAAAKPGIGWQVWNWGEPWTWDEALKQEFNAIFVSIDCILLSRKMAEEGYLDHWGRVAAAHPADPHYAFARRIVEVDKVVLSDKLPASRWARTIVAAGAMAEEVNALKRRPGRDIICFGGVGFASSLLAAGLVDELQLFVNPAAVGEGRSIFGASRDEGLKFALFRSTAHDCGIVVNRYRPTGGAR
jgi:dihydrofolate reductase